MANRRHSSAQTKASTEIVMKLSPEGCSPETLLSEAAALVARLNQSRDDFLHEALVKVFGTGIDRKFADSSHAAKYLARTANNLWIDFLRREQTFQLKAEEIQAQRTTVESETPESLRHAQELFDLLTHLDEKRRTVFLLHAIDEMSFSEIASEMGYTRSSNQPGIFYREAVATLRRLTGTQPRGRAHVSLSQRGLIKTASTAGHIVMLDFSADLAVGQLRQEITNLEWSVDQLRQAFSVEPQTAPNVRRAAVHLLAALTTRCFFRADRDGVIFGGALRCDSGEHLCVPFPTTELLGLFDESLSSLELFSKAERFSIVWRSAAAELSAGNRENAVRLGEECLSLARFAHPDAERRVLRWMYEHQLHTSLRRRSEVLDRLLELMSNYSDSWGYVHLEAALDLCETYLELGLVALAESVLHDLDTMEETPNSGGITVAVAMLDRRRDVACIRGRVLMQREEWDAAMAQFELAMSFQGIGEKRAKTVEFAWAALCAARAGREEVAWSYATACKTALAGSFWVIAPWESYVPLAEALLALGQSAEALEYLRKDDLPYARPAHIARANWLAAVAIGSSDPIAAQSHLDTALKLSSELDLPAPEWPLGSRCLVVSEEVPRGRRVNESCITEHPAAMRTTANLVVDRSPERRT